MLGLGLARNGLAQIKILYFSWRWITEEKKTGGLASSMYIRV